jgi:hypothetical protein
MMPIEGKKPAKSAAAKNRKPGRGAKSRGAAQDGVKS